jgi:AbrB family looped-hinge helix DNA binding protein
MYNSAITSLSTKGQVVIPEDIRKLIGLKEGAKMMVFTDGVNVMLKPIATPSMEEFEKMARATRQYAKKAEIKKSDVDEAIQKVRRRAHRS